MGGRGAFLESGGFNAPAQWETVGHIGGVKILAPKDTSKSLSLPERSNTPGTAYLQYNKDGTFKQLRFFNLHRIPHLDIDYHKLNGVYKLHKHNYTNGIRGKEHIPLTNEEFATYKKYTMIM